MDDSTRRRILQRVFESRIAHEEYLAGGTREDCGVGGRVGESSGRGIPSWRLSDLERKDFDSTESAIGTSSFAIPSDIRPTISPPGVRDSSQKSDLWKHDLSTLRVENQPSHLRSLKLHPRPARTARFHNVTECKPKEEHGRILHVERTILQDSSLDRSDCTDSRRPGTSRFDPIESTARAASTRRLDRPYHPSSADRELQRERSRLDPPALPRSDRTEPPAPAPSSTASLRAYDPSESRRTKSARRWRVGLASPRDRPRGVTVCTVYALDRSASAGLGVVGGAGSGAGGSGGSSAGLVPGICGPPTDYVSAACYPPGTLAASHPQPHVVDPAMTPTSAPIPTPTSGANNPVAMSQLGTVYATKRRRRNGKRFPVRPRGPEETRRRTGARLSEWAEVPLDVLGATIARDGQ
ncbi:hypothetical protein KM043_014553 [Ampulex compressa]|nr:hypothetical protein KM043_014553 [Ampulex compressa]